MGVLIDYFRAPDVVAVREHLDEHDGDSPVGAFDGVGLKWIEPGVTLARVIGFATDREWSVDLVDEKLVWPVGAERDMEYEGPWVSVLDDGSRDVLADIDAARIPELADRWAQIEEFHGLADPEHLREVLTELGALAARAREHGESLYAWMCL
ncbi:hypothetical protein [Actinoplanes sp. NPDC020271]|uniref:hypothetical protein n=1 Tax=Actinoplanes sp. NPDC020271 TaxID=3363896 RepID=UPI00379D10E4